MKKKIKLLLILFCIIPIAGFAQIAHVKGIVVDENNESLIGVTVKVTGQKTGTITGINGDYNIEATRGDVLEFSYVGYITQNIPFSGQSEIKVTMKEDSQVLDEVVVVGYGVQRKNDLTGSVVRADLSTMKNITNTNMVNALKGAVPGLNIGATGSAGGTPEISIRGRNSLSGTTSPLIVLDGIIYRGNINDINPSDIESIDVLKDASSAAIYGSQAANGVMLISTKKVKTNSKPIIEYDGTFTFQRLMSSDMKPLNKEEFLTQVEHANIATSRSGPDYLQKNPNWLPTDAMTLTSLLQGYANGTNTDWWGLTTEDVPYIQSHNMSIRGRSDLASYYFSFGFLDQKNQFKNDTYKRYSFRVNLETKITNWLRVGTQSFFSSNDLSGSNPNYSQITRLSALMSPYDDNGDLVQNLDIGFTNPLALINNPDKDMRYNLTGNFYADIDIPSIKGLNYRVNYSHNLTFSKDYEFKPYDYALQGSAYKNNDFEYAWTLDHILTYKRDFGKHAFNATLVYGIEKREFENTDASSRNFLNQTLGYNYMQAGQSDLNTISTGAWEESSLYMMGRLGYTFNDRYSLNATLRRDGFSGFGQNNKFALFPSAAAAWRISEESFIKNNVNWLDNLKLRLSYGTNGNRTLGRYSTMASMTSGNGYIYGSGSPELIMGVNAMPNNDLKWETTKSLNFGVDFSVLGGRLSGNFDMYRSNTSNLLYNVNIPSINGSTTVTTNIGKIQNKGYEISLTGVPIRTKDLEWTVSLAFSLNRNKVVSILGKDANGDGIEDDLVDARLFIGKPYGVVYDYNIIGLWQIADANAGIIPNGYTFGTYRFEDIDRDGSYSAAKDRKILGYTDPSYRFNIQSSLVYKGFELRAVINSIQGGSDYYYAQPMSGIYTGQQMNNYSFFNNFDYWLPENPNAKYQQLGSTISITTTPYVQRNFIRLQELSLSYNLPASLLRKAGINRTRIFVSGTNLFTITDWDGWDPESGIGITGSNAPMKQFTIGLSYEF